MSKPAQPLIDMKPTKDFLVAIDSDGCAFDAMGIKQRGCFCPSGRSILLWNKNSKIPFIPQG